MKTKIFRVLLISIILYSCNEHPKFDVKKWNDESDRDFFKNRNAMLEDLLDNYVLKGKSIKELEKIFGYIDYDSTINQKRISFEVYQEWRGIDPSLTKYLVLRLNKNKIVDSIYVYTYKR